MNSVFAVLGLAALCATSTAAPLGSHAQTPIEIASPAWASPIDPGLNSPAISLTLSPSATNAADPLPPVPRETPLVPTLVSLSTAAAFSAVFFLSRRTMRRGRRRGRRVRRRVRTMAYLI